MKRQARRNNMRIINKSGNKQQIQPPINKISELVNPVQEDLNKKDEINERERRMIERQRIRDNQFNLQVNGPEFNVIQPNNIVYDNILDDNILDENQPIVRSNVSLMYKRRPLPSRMNYLFNENPDFNFNRQIIPEQPNNDFKKLLLMGGFVGGAVLTSMTTKEYYSNIVDNIFNVGGGGLIQSGFNLVTSGIPSVASSALEYVKSGLLSLK